MASSEAKMPNSLDVPDEQVRLIEEKLDLEYTQTEVEGFDEWWCQFNYSSLQAPIEVADMRQVFNFMPAYPNYTDMQVNLFFKKQTGFTSDELQSIMETFSKKDPVFEVSLVKHSSGVISIGIGGKVRNSSTIFSGEYFGHYHPTQFSLEGLEGLPDCFVAGLMPSAGDIKSFFRFPQAVSQGTRIFSKNGYVFIKLSGQMDNLEEILEQFRQSYFGLFAGINNLPFKTDIEAIPYFKGAFGLDISFYYFDQKKEAS